MSILHSAPLIQIIKAGNEKLLDREKNCNSKCVITDPQNQYSKLIPPSRVKIPMKKYSFRLVAFLTLFISLISLINRGYTESSKGTAKKSTVQKHIKVNDSKNLDDEMAFPDETDRLEYEKEKNEIYSKVRKLLIRKKYNAIARELYVLSKKYTVDTDREYYFYMGIVYVKRSLYQNAVESYLKAIELSPNYSKARNSLGTLYCRLHKFHLAIEHFQKALEYNPYNPFINYNLGNLYFDIEDYQNALRYIQKAIEYKKNFGSAYHKLGIIMFTKKRYAESIEYFKSAIKFKKKSHTTYYYLGLAYYHLEEASKAVYCLKVALKFKRDFFEAALELGKMYQSYGEFENALILYKKSSRLNPDYDELSLLMVDCYRELRRYSDAIKIIKSLIEKYPDNERFKVYLKNLQEKRLIENLSEPPDYYSF